MRATVSIMLSHGGGDPNLARPDYEQTTLHHGYLLVLLRGVGPSKPRSLQKVFDKVRHVNNVKIKDSSGITRDIWVRYIHDHPVENNDLGDFQTHRRLLGLITIGKFDSQTELNELCRHHESLKVRYSNTLYDTRAIFFGPANDNHKAANSNHVVFNNDVVDTNARNPKNQISCNENVSGNETTDTTDSVAKTNRLQDEYTTPSNFKSQAFFYREYDTCADLDGHITEFANNIFWVLESKRLERSREKLDKVSMLYAPFEKKDFVGFDMESRNNRKRCVGRFNKNVADLSLQCGLVEESLGLYHSAYETLRSISDSLWEGAAEEGLCAASSILLYPHLREIESIHRNASLQEGSSPLRKSPEKWRASDLTKKVTVPEQNFMQQNKMTSASSSCSSVSSILTNSSATSPTTTTSSSSTSTTTQNHFGGVGLGELPGNILKPEEIPVKFRRAIILYSKYSYAGIIETEAALKAARICIEQNRPLDVAMFLQNILHITLTMSEAEQVKRFEIITELYHQIGYQRKAAFFQRLAALKHVQQGNKTPDWSQSYSLMLLSFCGYLLTLDPLEVIENSAGWPSLQIDLLQSLISAARRLGHSALATRHMTFLLQTQWDNMSAKEQSDMAVQLQNLSAQCEGAPVPLVLENGTVIPPANLTDLPYCLDLTVKDLPAHLKPLRMKIMKADNGPFLFTPIHFNSVDRRERQKEKNKIAFLWVQNNLSEITLHLKNPLPFELIVSDMRLLTNGIVFESLPQTVTLQPNVPTQVVLHGTPIEIGQLEIQGYSTHTLGVKSNCRLKHMRERNFPPNYLIDVIPALPSIALKTSLPQSASFCNGSNADLVITSANLSLYNGESSTCTVTVINESSLPVEYLDITINSNVEQELQKKIFQIDEEDLKSKLPIPPNSYIEFNVKVFAEADFICPIVGQRTTSVHSSSIANISTHNEHVNCTGPQSLPYSTVSSGHASLPSRINLSNQQLSLSNTMSSSVYNNRRNDPLNASARSTSTSTSTTTGGGNSSLAALSIPAQNLTGCNPDAQHIEAQFRIKYSGGEAMEAGYCRQCAISFHLELLPSAQITSWDVLPAEIPSKFYLVLDVSNLTAQEMSLQYTDTKYILIEAKESCRVPIPVDRCSLEEVCKARQVEYVENMEKELCFRTQMLSFSDSISKLCSEHIAENVKISWLLSGTNNHGIASLRGIVLTQAMTDLTTVSPLEWSVLFQNTPIQPQSEIVCTAGQSAILSVTVCNQSIQPLKNLVLTIKFYQDYLNGMENYNLETRVAISGPSRVDIPLLNKNEKVHHECTVLFFTPGSFKTSIKCCSTPQITNNNNFNNINNNLFTRSCPVPETTTMATASTTSTSSTIGTVNGSLNSNNSNVRNGVTEPTFYDITGATSYHEQQEHVWKFIPPIEVTVVEP